MCSGGGISAALADDDGQGLLEPLAHELRLHLETAVLAVAAMKTGTIGIGGATAAVLDGSHKEMRKLIDRALAWVRVTTGLPPRLATWPTPGPHHEK